MTNTATHTDPRPLYRDALTWVSELIDEVAADQLTLPTPCTEFDVRRLLGHLVATVERARVIGAGGEPATIPLVLTDIPDDGYGNAYRAATDRMWSVWNDDTLLDTEVTPPWGAVPGRGAIGGYLNETLVHGWDLAVATGQNAEAAPELAEAALSMARAMIPASPRGGDFIPFDEVVESSVDAGPTERLANWSGHSRKTSPGQ
ncbi:TIGR03086 family metal-binding protein [Rhodococcus sp. NPDC058521]|uniref:TIGR03086 family metal-binding protein n=1 Tax=Rhodococcus sp. NPDC058521 TaxID=3346536 RepID=UPI00365166F0